MKDRQKRAVNGKKLCLGIVSAIVLVSLCVIAVLLFVDNDTFKYQKDGQRLVFKGDTECSEPIKDFLKAIVAKDGNAYFKVFPPVAVADYSDESAPTVQVHFGYETVSDFLTAQMEEYKSIYGDNLVITAKVVSEEDASFADIKDYSLDEYTWKTYVTESSTEAIKKITIDYTVKGDLDEDNRTVKVYVVKIGGEWYMHPLYVFKSL